MGRGAKRVALTRMQMNTFGGHRLWRRWDPCQRHQKNSILLALGFVLAQPEVDTIIVGTHNPSHLSSNIEMVTRQLPIPARKLLQALHRRFDEADDGWLQLT